MTLTPVALPETQAFWDAAQEERLDLQRCQDCARFYFPPAPVCRYCSSRNILWETASGRATLYSYVISATPWPQWQATGSFSVATVALAEGPRLLSTIVGCEQSPAALRIDMPLIAAWRRFGDGPNLLCFAPDAELAA